MNPEIHTQGRLLVLSHRISVRQIVQKEELIEEHTKEEF